MSQNKATFQVTLDGVDLTDRIAPRLISLTITEKRGERADQLDIILHDHDGKLAIPKTAAKLKVKIGWEKGDDVTPGLVDKGTFTVDEAEHSGPPDIVTIRARSAEVTKSYRTRKDKGHKDTTLGAIVKKVASDNGLTAHVDATLASIEIPVLGQSAKSDMAFVRDLGRKYDATATVKDGKLIFAPIGTGKTASGKSLPSITLTRQSGWDHRFARADRDTGKGVEAQWHDPKEAKRKTVKAGSGEKARRLKKVHATESDAKHAAESAHKRDQRKAATFDYTLALGRPDLAVETKVTLKGWKAEIDAIKWLVSEATHSFTPQGGLKTSIKLETALP
jgi:uncharacterized protein